MGFLPLSVGGGSGWPGKVRGMRSIAIVTDTSAALSGDTLARLSSGGGFVVVDLPVRVGDWELSGVPAAEVDEAIATAHVQGEQVSTSGPAVGEFVDVYESLAQQGYAAVVSVHLSGALSGTCDSARAAANLVNIPVCVVDSQTLAMALGTAVVRLYEATAELDDVTRAVELAEDLCAAAQFYFFIPTLDALKRGGRVSPALAMVAQMFQIRPVATVQDGRLVYLERPRTTARAIERLTELVAEVSEARAAEFEAGTWAEFVDAGYRDREVLVPKGEIVAVHFCGNAHQAQDLKMALGPAAEGAEVTPLPAVLSAHSGLGALAVAVF